MLQQAGYVDVGIEAVTAELLLGSSVEAAMMFTARVGPLSRPLALLEGDEQQRALAALRELLAQHFSAGAVRFGARCWLATARR